MAAVKRNLSEKNRVRIAEFVFSNSLFCDKKFSFIDFHLKFFFSDYSTAFQ